MIVRQCLFLRARIVYEAPTWASWAKWGSSDALEAEGRTRTGGRGAGGAGAGGLLGRPRQRQGQHQRRPAGHDGGRDPVLGLPVALGLGQAAMLLVLPGAMVFSGAFYASLKASIDGCIDFDG